MNEDLQKAGCVWSVAGLVLLVVTLLTGGTFRTEVSVQLPAATAVSDEVAFEETVSVSHWLGGLVRGERVNLRQLLAARLRDGEQVTGLTVESKHTFTDLLIMGVTLGIYAPDTVVIRGTIGRRVESAAG
jgi:hypothetical protein